jgi:hypothetical protein
LNVFTAIWPNLLIGQCEKKQFDFLLIKRFIYLIYQNYLEVITMKNLFIVLAATVLLVGCGKKWPDADREKFLTACKSTDMFGMSKEKVAAFCDCELAVYEKNYANMADKEAKEKDATASDANMSITMDLLSCMPKGE